MVMNKVKRMEEEAAVMVQGMMNLPIIMIIMKLDMRKGMRKGMMKDIVKAQVNLRKRKKIT